MPAPNALVTESTILLITITRCRLAAAVVALTVGLLVAAPVAILIGFGAWFGVSSFFVAVQLARVAFWSVKGLVEILAAEKRREEIARMLAGAEITAEARAAAERLIKAAG